jgi:hypothetical protein
MASGRLRVHRVRRYRVPRYPSPWRPWGDPLRRTKRAAAMLALPAALGVGCHDGPAEETLGGMGPTYCPADTLTKAEALAIVEAELAAGDWSRPDGCPTVPDRWVRNERYEWSPPEGVFMTPFDYTFDWLAPAETLPASGTCPGANVKTVGIAVWDDETTERPADCYEPCYSPSLDYARRNHDAALRVFDMNDYFFGLDSPLAECSPSPWRVVTTREEAEATLRADVRAFVTGLRADGFL